MRIAIERTAAATAVLAVVLAALGVVGGGSSARATTGDDGSDGQAPAGVGDSTATPEAITFDLLTGPDRDLPVTIDADLWRPDSATATNPAPAIVLQHGYGNDKAADEMLTNAAYFSSHGYVVVSISTQGFGGSTGCIALDSIDYDGANTIGIIDWLATQDYVATDAEGDPKVALMGGSYGGGHQGLVGVTDPRVDALAPGRTWNTLQFSLVPNNWADPDDPFDLDHDEQGVFKQQWTTLFYALGLTQPAMGNGGCDPVTRQTRFPTAAPCAGYIPGICEIYAQLISTGMTDQAGRDLVGTAALATRIDELDTPTILAQGLPDTLFTPTETVPTILSLQDRDVPVVVFWHSSGHGGYEPAPGDGEPYGGTFSDAPEDQEVFADTYWARRHLQFFEKHVRGRDVDTGPAFAWFRDWVDYDIEQTGGTSAPAYGTADVYPPPQAPGQVFTLDPADASLQPPGATIEGGTASFLNPPGGQPAAYSETANFSSPGQPGDQPATEVPGQFAEFLTEPFAAATDVVGVPELRLHLAHDNPASDAVLFAKLYEVDADGNETLIRRQVAPARIPDDALAAGAVDIHMVGLSNRFEAGHRARLVLASTDQAYFNNRLADQLTVTSTPDQPSTLTLPIVASSSDGGAGTTDPDPAPAPDDSGDDTPSPDLAATGGGAAALAVGALAVAVSLRRRRPVG